MLVLLRKVGHFSSQRALFSLKQQEVFYRVKVIVVTFMHHPCVLHIELVCIKHGVHYFTCHFAIHIAILFGILLKTPASFQFYRHLSVCLRSDLWMFKDYLVHCIDKFSL